MAPKHHPAPLSGGDRKALKKEHSKSCAILRRASTSPARSAAPSDAAPFGCLASGLPFDVPARVALEVSDLLCLKVVAGEHDRAGAARALASRHGHLPMCG